MNLQESSSNSKLLRLGQQVQLRLPAGVLKLRNLQVLREVSASRAEVLSPRRSVKFLAWEEIYKILPLLMQQLMGVVLDSRSDIDF